MISPTYVRTMARYNAWQNGSLFEAASGLDEAQRRLDRGAFFGSIHATFCHLLWADRMWLSRFSDQPKPVLGIRESGSLIAGWDDLAAARRDADAVISAWADRVSPDWLASDMTWFSGALGRTMRAPAGLLVAHFFNHQTHHRGQVHALLTAAGARPEATDLMMVDEPR